MARILVIEDVAAIRRLIRWSLEPEGHVITEAPDARRGLLTLREGLPELIVLDVMLPGDIDGYALCRTLKSQPRWAHIPVLLLTSLSSARERATGEQAGATAYLTKPFVPMELVEVVEALLLPT
ncbi:response regulator transcription factor [Sphaerotilus mobilis]|uniref:Response regulator receiver domain-containing protein n=1 Tax=Sphaerotilus mobilis TaxID=47994 RepID=A0A4Q7LKW1_9BURK|nr:response regulator [Sphaerotilus mobilis]RZS54773.1 response regulator receiver domain-containing protein [Sphaerotilus mobilis]